MTPDCAAPAADRCRRGHAFNEGNTYVDRRGYRTCRTCRRETEARRRASRRKAVPLTAEQRSMRARAAAFARHAQTDPRPSAARASAAFLQRFEHQVDPAGTLPPAERTKRALAARRAHFVRLQLASSQARARRAGGKAQPRSS